MENSPDMFYSCTIEEIGRVLTHSAYVPNILTSNVLFC